MTTRGGAADCWPNVHPETAPWLHARFASKLEMPCHRFITTAESRGGSVTAKSFEIAKTRVCLRTGFPMRVGTHSDTPPTVTSRVTAYASGTAIHVVPFLMPVFSPDQRDETDGVQNHARHQIKRQ